jgi:Domain of unknown function (DUF5916)
MQTWGASTQATKPDSGPSNGSMTSARTGLRWQLVSICAFGALSVTTVSGQTSLAGPPLRISRAQGPIAVDGQLTDEGWRGAAPIETWYETNPGDNIVPAVKNVGYLTYDDRFFYAAFEFSDPDPGAIRSPYADHDHVSGNYTDYAGVILDTRNDGHSAVLLLASASGIQYDAVTDDDGSGEDSSPDFFWDSAARVTPTGWTLELRVPFSSLRYHNVDPQTWGILLYRNYPRTFRYQYFSAKLPRGDNCFICRANTLIGLEQLPSGQHLIAAPYLAAAESGRRSTDAGAPFDNEPVAAHIGIDVKWIPSADNVIDFTVKPDFSQVEADTAQISANERFALSFSEKRPFFLEGVELFSTPMQAVYTRTITSPRWGTRATGKQAGLGYTVLVTEDAGGGSVIIPGPYGSSTASQDFSSTVLVGRAKRNFGRSFLSMLVTDRELHDGNGFNRLAGPDFQWRPSSSDTVVGQWLWSETRLPQRPDLSAGWNGASLDGHAAHLQWNHNTTHLDLFAQYRNLDRDFRADAGFIPQVGYREISTEGGWTFRPTGFLSRLRTFVIAKEQRDQDGATILRQVSPGAGMDARWNSFIRVRYAGDQVRDDGRLFDRQQLIYTVQTSPSRRVARIEVDGVLGEEIDFVNSRPGRGSTINLSATLSPTDHLELALTQNQRTLHVVDGGSRQKLFTARVSRIRANYSFSSRTFVRAIGQYVTNDRQPELYLSPVTPRTATFSTSALFAYKLNWQSVLFVGYGDERELLLDERLQQSGRQFFVKMSYAFQR